jgi:hypothetical protein
VPLLRRPIVSTCVRCAARPNNLGMCLELQARPGSCVGECSSAQEGGETDGLPWLVDVLCEVGERLCRDILCLVRWVGVRHAVGPSSARDCLGTERRGGRPRAMGGDRSYPIAVHQVVTNTICVVWRELSVLAVRMQRVAS